MVLQTHLENSVPNSPDKKLPHYLSPQTQNEFIQLMSNQIFKSIIKSVKESKYYSIILDCTPDISHREQMSVVLRYVATTDGLCEIKESFLGFLPVEEKTGEGLTNAIISFLKASGLEIKNIRGKAYDNGSNIKGRISGVQKRIRDENPLATFVACANHNCNLILSDGAKSTTQTITFFGIIQKLYTFASGSTNRWDFFRKNVTKLSLKPLSTTRWESRIDSLKPMRYQISKIRDTLDEIGNSDKFDADTKFEAKNLVSQIEKYEFLVLLSAWFDLLQHLNLVSKVVQEPKVDVNKTLELIKTTEVYLENYRATGFKSAQLVKGLGEELGLGPEEMKFFEKRVRRSKRNFGEAAEIEDQSSKTAE